VVVVYVYSYVGIINYVLLQVHAFVRSNPVPRHGLSWLLSGAMFLLRLCSLLTGTVRVT